MKPLNSRILLFLLLALVMTLPGCGASIGTMSKAPVTKVLYGGSTQERKQEFTLKRVKYQHVGAKGRVLGLRHFTDTGRPITGVRRRDTLFIDNGFYKGNYTVKRVIRLRKGKTRKVIIELTEPFKKMSWSVAKSGRFGRVVKGNIFTDGTKYLPAVEIGSQVLIGGIKPKPYTVIGISLVNLNGQRVGYRFAEKLPKNLSNAGYKVRVPASNTSSKLSYRIAWRGSSLSGYKFTIGINRRRYNNKEMEDLLRSNPDSKKKLSSVASKTGAATVLRITGGLAIVVGGFLGLVRRDDFQGNLTVVPWSILGGGVVLIGVSVPFTVSANGDFLEAAKTYNASILSKLRLPKKMLQTKAKKGQTTRSLAKKPAPAVRPLHVRH